MIHRLVMRRGPTPGAIFELEIDEVRVGRGSKNHIIIHDNDVSREHFVLRRGPHEDFYIEDVGSTNGTFIDGQKLLSARELSPGARIEMGDTITLEYERFAIPGADLAETDGLDPEDAALYNHYLIMTHGPGIGSIFAVDGVITTLGRESGNDIVVQDIEVSRYHARLRRERTGISVEDVGSTNGTSVNGVRLDAPYLLRPDDIIRFGSIVTFQYVRRPASETLEVNAYRRAYDVSSAPTKALAGRDDTLVGMVVRDDLHVLQTGIEPNALLGHVMIVYARADWERIVAPLTVKLQDAGIPVWAAQYLLPDTEPWRMAVEQALAETEVLLMVITAHAAEDLTFKTAYRAFSAAGKPVVALICDPALQHTVPSSVPAVSYTRGEGLDELLAMLDGLRT